MAIDLDDIVAAPGFAPRAWQREYPQELYTGHKPPVAMSDDLRRVIALPRRDQVAEASPSAVALVDMISERYRKPNSACKCASMGRACIHHLRVAQAWGLYEIGLVAGLLGPIGVGHGKTILDILTPLSMPGCRVALLLIPANLVDQIIGDYEAISQHFHVPSMNLHTRNYCARVPGAPWLHVFPYSKLQLASSTRAIEEIAPDTIIADEVDCLRNADTARTSRVLRYFAAHPGTRFCGWSGSLSEASIKDYAHLSALALRNGSPMPLDPEVAEDWSRAIDPSDWPAPPGALLKLCDPGEEHVFDGYHRRLVDTLGVVATTSSSVDIPLEITERHPPAMPAHLEAMIESVRETWIRPDGEWIVDALTVSRCLRELACGFYYRWRYPRIRGVEQNPDTIDDWKEARKLWHGELRQKLKTRAEHMDSEMLLTHAAERHHGDRPKLPGMPVWDSMHWPRWRNIKSAVVYETEPVRVDDFLMRDAAEWAHEERGIIWYDSNAVGVWLAEISGLPMFGGGPEATKMIYKEHGERSIIASIHSHGRGRDGLQRWFSTQLVAQPPSNGTKWEQMLGRLHRTGQAAPLVTAKFYRHTEDLADHVDQALRRAVYVQETLGAAQKLRVGFLGTHGRRL